MFSGSLATFKVSLHVYKFINKQGCLWMERFNMDYKDKLKQILAKLLKMCKP